MMSLGFAPTCICRSFLQCWWRAPACTIVIYSLVVSVGPLLARDLVPGAGLHPRPNTKKTCFFCFSNHAKTKTTTRRRAHCRIAIEGIAHAYTNLVSTHLQIIAYVCNTIDNAPHNPNACCKLYICPDMQNTTWCKVLSLHTCSTAFHCVLS